MSTENPFESTANLAWDFTRISAVFTVLLLWFPLHAAFVSGDPFGYFIPIVGIVPTVLAYAAHVSLRAESERSGS